MGYKNKGAYDHSTYSALHNIVFPCLSCTNHNHGCDKAKHCDILNVFCDTIVSTLKSYVNVSAASQGHVSHECKYYNAII